MKPDECLKKVYQIETHGGVETYMKTQQEKQPSALNFAKKKVEWHRQELKYWKERLKYYEKQKGKR